MRRMAVIMMAILVACLAGGCTGERAGFEIAKQTGTLLTVAATNASETLERVQIDAEGRIQDPHYRVLAAWVTGVLLDIGLDGIYLSGRALGEGSGRLTDPEAVAALQAALRERMGERYPGDELVLAAVEAIRNVRPPPIESTATAPAMRDDETTTQPGS